MKTINILVVVALMTGGLHLHAQTVGVEYTTELQTNFRESNFVNLLWLNADMPIGKSFSLETATISVARTRDVGLIDDLQTFSNIEEENLPLAIAVCGTKWQINDKHSLFLGIRNMNEDYFTSPVTSFFTNSSCGIYPTISCNYPIANYPLSSVGLHYRYDSEGIGFQASVYNGQGYNRFTGRENVFRFCPEGDGVFALGQLDYHFRNSHWFLGACGHYGNSNGTSLWAYTEQPLTDKFCWIVAYSHALGAAQSCTDFIGLGGKYTSLHCEFGIFTDYAHFTTTRECATEISCKMQLRSNLYIQPTAHLIVTGAAFHAISMLRLCWSI